MRYGLRTLLITLFALGESAFSTPPNNQNTAPGELRAAEAVESVDWADLAFTIKDRAQFNLTQLPERIRALEGKRVRLRGYFHLGTDRCEATEFLLLGEIKTRPVNSKPGNAPDEQPIDQLAAVEMAPGQTVSVTLKPIAVTGRLEFEVVKWNGKAVIVFRIIAESVKEVKPRSGYGPALVHGC